MTRGCARRADSSAAIAGLGLPSEGFLVAVAAASGLGDRVRVLHDLDDADFLAWLAASDVVVDLRHPHRGEVSGSLARAMQAGRPTIVSGVGTYLDVSAEHVHHVAPGYVEPAELAAAIRRLAEPAVGRAMGEAAARFLAQAGCDVGLVDLDAERAERVAGR